MTFEPGHSAMHRLHPLVKLAWLVWVTIAVFAFDSVALPLLVTGWAVMLLWWSGVAPWRVSGVRLWMALAAAVLTTHSLAAAQGDPVFGPVTVAGLVNGVRATGRLLAIILMSTLFVTTTEPVSLAYALMRIGLPYRWGFALVTALRLAPVFRLEAHHISRAQIVRGAVRVGAGPRTWWSLLRRVSFPMLISALRTAHALSLSMEGRAFGLYRRRTYIRTVDVGYRDVVAGLLLALSIAAAIGHR